MATGKWKPSRRAAVTILVLFVAVAFVPASSAMPGLWPGSLPPGIHASYEKGGVVSINVCPTPTRPGTAACFAYLRIDSPAGSDRPAPTGAAAPADVLGDNGGYSPAFLQSAYNAPSTTGGTGKTVAIVDAFDDPNAASDLAAYRSHYGLPACTVANGCFRKVNQNGQASPLPGTDPSGDGGWELETSLDLDMVSALCPKCHILLVEAKDASSQSNGSTPLLKAVDTAVSLGADTVSMSWGTAFHEDGGTTFTHPGVRFFAASGDSGYHGEAEFPAASPNVTAVGGTTLDQATSTGTRDATETAWSGSGSGCDLFNPTPSWQPDVCSGKRAVADISAEADPATPVWLYDTFPAGGATGWLRAGGTSAATPIVAALSALSTASFGGVDDPAAIPYSHSSAFNDITSGAAADCQASTCQAGPGYDLPTGLGTPNGVTGLEPARPGPVQNLTAGAESAKVNLSWAAPTLDGGASITGYRVFRSDHGAVPIASLGASARTFTNPGLANGTTYTYHVLAVNAIGQGAISGVSAKPAAVAKLVLSPGTATVQAGGSLQYSVAGLDAHGNSLGDETAVAKVSMGHDGSCGQGLCEPTTSGTHTVTATLGGVTATAKLTVRTGLLGASSLIVKPRVASMSAGGSQTFTATEVDDYGNRIADATSDVVFQISPNGSCKKNVCTAAKPGVHQVSAIMKSTAIATGAADGCAFVVTGSVACWGTNYLGNLADAVGIGDETVPTAVPGLEGKGVTSLSLASGFGCALVTGGAAECWGLNDGNLGNASATSSLVPTPVVGLTSGVKSISANWNTCAVTSAGDVDCWGQGDDLWPCGPYPSGAHCWGDGAWQPAPIVGLGGKATSVAASFDYFACAIMTTTGVKCWGADDYGMLGDNNADSQGPVTVTGLASGVRQVVVGQIHACALTTAREVKCWGYNGDGELGNGTTKNSGVPVAVTGLPGAVKSISAGGDDTCAVTTSGALYCWGADGNGYATQSNTPKLVPGLGSGVQSVSVGGATCALTTAGLVKCWGNNHFGQLGVPGAGFFSAKPVVVDIGSTFATPATLHVGS